MKAAPTALTRDQFREGVFLRDSHTCVICGKPGVDAHHILERKLWDDGGYHFDNGATLCAEHHLEAEGTTLSVEDIRIAAGITRIIVPDHLYPDQPYDKWGNPILPNKTRVKGELFDDESVQKVLSAYGMLSIFTDRVKYPRTYHCPWSQCVNSDDRVITNFDDLEAAEEVVVTEKMDGENTTCGKDYFHARSVDSANHPSRNRVKALWATFAHEIPQGWRICGENLYAKHAIGYNELPSFLLGFSIWDEKNNCLPWDETLEWFELLGITPVPVLYRGKFDPVKIQALWDPKTSAGTEGYVIRDAGEIGYSQFRKKVAKFVRANHVQESKHWMHGQAIIPNQLKS